MAVRSRLLSVLISAGASLGAGLSVAHAQPVVRGLGFLAGADSTFATGISADGQHVIGHSLRSAGPITPVRWSLAGVTPIIEPIALPAGWSTGTPVDVSAGGGVVTGWNFDLGAGGIRSFRSDASGPSPLVVPAGWSNARGHAVTPDGSSILGTATLADGFSSVVQWTEPQNPVALPRPVGATSVGRPVVDDAGNVYAGAAYGSGGERLVRLGSDQPLVDLPGPNSTVARVSGDGSTFLGNNFILPGGMEEMWIWSQAAGFSTITPGAGFSHIVPSAVAPDGSVAFGADATTDFDVQAPFAWTLAGGKMSVEDYFASIGVDLTGWSDVAITDVSADGTRFVGSGLANPSQREALLIVVPSPGTISMSLLGLALAARRRR